MQTGAIGERSRRSPTVAPGDLCIVLVIGALGVLLALQGWRARVPAAMWMPAIDEARTLLSHGQLPDRGSMTSYTSYAPPGFAWAAVPGMLLFSDPRLFLIPANVVLHIGTLIGIFLLAKACFGRQCALLSVVLYGLSPIGLLFAGFFEPRGHPVVYVWMAYWACWWVTQRDSRYLAASLMTWLVGMYGFLEIAPALFILPAVWAFYRPPARLRSLVVVGALGLLMWYPYLRFEATRKFVDVRSQVLLQPVEVENTDAVWCQASPGLHEWAGSLSEPDSAGDLETSRSEGWVTDASRRVLAITRGMVSNFEGLVPEAEIRRSWTNGVSLLLLALTVLGLLTLSVRHGPQSESDGLGGSVRSHRRWLTALAFGLLIWSVLANEVVIDRALDVPLGERALPNVRILQALSALGGIALLKRRSVARAIQMLASTSGAALCDPRVVAIALVVPWVVLLLVVEWGREDRLVPLWPLQVIVLTFFLSAVWTRMGSVARIARWAVPSLVLGVVLVNPLVWSQIGAWRQDGWSGRDAVEVQIADYLAARVRADGRDRAAIGYRSFVGWLTESSLKAADSRMREGERVDLILRYRYGVLNLNQCGEGVSERDEYRVVEMYPPSDDTRYYFDVPPDGRFRFLDQIGNYELYEIDRSP